MLPAHPIGDFLEGWIVRATCRNCRHGAELDMAAVVARLGKDCPMEKLTARLVCEACGMRGRALIGTVPARWAGRSNEK